MKALSWIHNIKLPIKLGVIAVLAIIGVSIPTFNYYKQAIASEASDAMELKGIQPTSAVVKLKKVLAEHRGMSSSLFGGNTSVANALNSKGVEVNEQLRTVKSLVDANSDSSEISSHINRIEQNWQSIKAGVDARRFTRAETISVHSVLIADADLLISELSRYFLLSYDPAAASYHGIIANFNNLPRLANNLGQIRGVGAGILANGEITTNDKSVIRGFLANVQSPLVDFTYNMGAAAEADERFKSNARIAEEIGAKIDELKNLVDTEILQANTAQFDSSEYFSRFSSLINDLFDLHDENVQTLSTVIEERVQKSQAIRYAKMTTIVSLLFVSMVIGVIIAMSITRSANGLIAGFKRISEGDFELDLNLSRKDEMGLLEKGLNALSGELQEASVAAIEASKVKQALDTSSTAFMLSDGDRTIAYMNESAVTLLKECESEIRKDLPNFNADKLIGTKIDEFHKNPSHQHKVLDQLKTAHEAKLDLGDYSFRLMISPIRDAEGNNLGNSVEWHDMTAIYEEEKRVARILEALDTTSTNVMLADANNDIIYMNRSLQLMLKAAEQDVQKTMPHFNVDSLLNGSMDRFHKNPEHQKSMVARLTDKHITDITVGKRHFRLTASPIFGADGERIGSVVEWLDRTKEFIAEKEISQMVDASLQGDFTKRVNTDDKEGFMLTMAKGLNQLVSTTEGGLNEVSNVLLAISEGDLTKRIETDYSGTFNDLKNYCNTTSENLVNVISQIRNASDTINSASTEIAAGNSDLSTRTEQQASSLEETASSMEQLTSTVRLNSENANQANGLASQASEVADNGGKLISEVVTTMASINESAQKIADIIGVIDGIAFQTNILALNAAVEAARAGEQGRGFAVVASEVRSLAQRSANAAKDIKDLISDSVTKVESGNELVSQSGDTMQEIVVSIQRVNDIMSEIAAASAEQASGIDEVSKAVSHMDEMTQQNAALVEEAAAAAASMSSQASDLNQQVGTFKLDESDAHKAQNASSTQSPQNKQSSQYTQAPPRVSQPDLLSKQFDELPSVNTNASSEKPSAPNKIIQAPDVINEEDEWESF